MVKAIVTKTGNSYALRLPMSYFTESHLKPGDVIDIESPVERSQKALKEFVESAARQGGLFKSIKDPVAWQRGIRAEWRDPWGETEGERRAD